VLQPYPILPGHVTVAAARHQPQDWADAEDCKLLLETLYDLAAQAPACLIWFNGVGAGASVRGHRHVHLARRERRFPLQEAARRAGAAAPLVPVGEPHYPLTAVRLRGTREFVVREGLALALRWRDSCPAATENLLSTLEDGQVTLYFVPRDRALCRASGLSGCPGGLEVFGEFVLSTPAEWELIEQNRVGFAFLRAALESVRPVRGLGERVGAMVRSTPGGNGRSTRVGGPGDGPFASVVSSGVAEHAPPRLNKRSLCVSIPRGAFGDRLRPQANGAIGRFPRSFLFCERLRV